MEQPVVITTSGPVQGEAADGVHIFKGIPYGRSTAGAARFRPPQRPDPWTDVRPAIAYGPSAPQKGVQVGEGPMAQAVIKLAADSLEERFQGEDCLVLNVWAPAAGDQGLRPVMVWLHGGAWANSSGSAPLIDGTNLVRRGDVVVLTVNHRLGALGYIYLGGLDPEQYPDSGNAGLLDLVAALEWVRDNIASFGGDPSNVTIFGESGGGQKVATLLGMPHATGLFHKAVIQSGPMLKARTAEDATVTAKALLSGLGIGLDEIERLEQVPADQIVEMQSRLESGGIGALGGGHAFSPVVDGRSLPEHPFDPVATASASRVPLIIGTNKDELTLYTAVMPGFDQIAEAPAKLLVGLVAGERTDELFATYASKRPGSTPAEVTTAVLSDYVRVGSIRLAERKLAGGPSPVFVYLFSFETDVLGGVLKAAHGLDIAFVFDNVATTALTGTRPERQDVADAMADSWIAFATTGDPSAKGQPSWPAYTLQERATMIFDAPCSVQDDPFGAERAAWEGISLPL